MTKPHAMRDYALVTACYWAFTLTDGALRVLVLLFLSERGFTPLELATAFVGYEALGVVTNLAGGWVGARLGLRVTLFTGLALQLAALLALGYDPSALTIPLVLAAQAVSGVAKDLTKMSSKSWVKLVVPEGDARGLLKWVSLLTGSKNALKGVGFFAGGLLLSTVGFQRACVGMAALIALALLLAALLLGATGGGRGGRFGGAQVEGLLSRDARVNWLAAARLFLFAARDAWFVVALPLCLATVLGWDSWRVGAFLAAWVIAYGAVQASAPVWVGTRSAGERVPPDGKRLALWTAALALPLAGLAAALRAGADPTVALVIGLYAFGFVFAANSAVHSYLIVHYADSDAVAQRVGFYYASNAAGRLLGTFASGALYQWGGAGIEGLVATLVAAVACVLVSAALAVFLGRAERALPQGRPSSS